MRTTGLVPDAPLAWRERAMFAALFLVYLLFGGVLNSVGSVNLLAVQGLGVARAEVALLDAYKDLPIALVSFLLASALPRLGLKRAMLIALALVAAASAAVPALSSFWAIKLFYVTAGVAFALAKVSVYASIGLVTRNASGHAGLTSLVEGMFMLGVLGGYALFSRFSAGAADALAWLGVFKVFAAVALAAFALLLVARMDETPAHTHAEPEAAAATLLDDFAAMLALLRRVMMAVFIGATFLYVLIEQGVGTWLPSFNREVLHLPTSMSVGLAVIMPASTALGRLIGAALMARWGWARVVRACLVAIGALILATVPLSRGVAPPAPDASWWHAPTVAYLLPLIGLFLAPIYPGIISALLTVLPRDRHAAATGLIVIFSALGGSFGSLVIGRLFVLFDGVTAFLMLIVPLALLGLCLRLFSAQLRNTLTSAPSAHVRA